jgi:hypothetical protein
LIRRKAAVSRFFQDRLVETEAFMRHETKTEASHDPEVHPPHLAVWVDHLQARLFWLYRERSTETAIRRDDPRAHGNVHHHSGTPGNGHAPLEPAYLEKISDAIGAAEEILLLGPLEARRALKTFLEHHKPAQAHHVLGDEALDHCDPAIIDQRARAFFRHADLMQGKRV